MQVGCGTAARVLFVPRTAAGIVGAEENSRHFLAEKIGDELLLVDIAVKVDFIVKRRIIMQDFRRYFRFCTATHDNFVNPHGGMIT